MMPTDGGDIQLPHKRRRNEMENDPSELANTLRDTDVLSGIGRSVNSRPGNQSYLTILSLFGEFYQSISYRAINRKLQLFAIQNYVYHLVREGGSRFMKRDRENGLVEELSMRESLGKIRVGLQSSYTPTFRTEGKSEPDPIQTREVFQKEPDNGNTLLAPLKEQSPAVPAGTPKAYDSDYTKEETFKLRDEDVLVGQDSGLKNHPGNADYLAEVRKHQQEYQVLKREEHDKRKGIVMNILTWVVIRNGRFLRQEADGEYQELSATEALTKIEDNLLTQSYVVLAPTEDLEVSTFVSNYSRESRRKNGADGGTPQNPPTSNCPTNGKIHLDIVVPLKNIPRDRQATLEKEWTPPVKTQGPTVYNPALDVWMVENDDPSKSAQFVPLGSIPEDRQTTPEKEWNTRGPTVYNPALDVLMENDDRSELAQFVPLGSIPEDRQTTPEKEWNTRGPTVYISDLDVLIE